MRQRIFLLLALLLALAPPVAAQEIRPFVSGSIREITAARQGKPFILGLWSLTCTHCREELSLLAGMVKKYPHLDLVLVATDTPEEGEAIGAALSQSGLGGTEAWVFADSFAERLRFEVDRKWHGELPRTYFYDATHAMTAISGKLDRQRLDLWMALHLGRS